jgi:thiol-disulfide isomerase/thioredoxin
MRAREKRGRERGGWRRATYIAAFIPAALFIGLIAFLLAQPLGPANPGISERAVVGAEAPDFTLRIITPEGLSDEAFTLSSARGRVVFLDFAWWRCPHCNNMEPVVGELAAKYGARGVVFVTVMIDDQQSPVSESAGFVERHGIFWTAVWDEGARVADLYGVQATPSYIIIGRDGRVAVRLPPGEQPEEALERALESVLG